MMNHHATIIGFIGTWVAVITDKESLSMTDISKMVAIAYERDSRKPELVSFNHTVRISRKFGFPFICTNNDKTENDQMLWAAKLLVQVAESYPLCDIPDDFKLEKGTKLHDDAQRLLVNALSNTERVQLE